MHISKKLLLIIGIICVISGCATTNFATTSSPAKISEEFIREGVATWRGTRILGFNGNYLKTPTMDSTYTIDPGPVNILISYRENKGEISFPPKFYDTYPLAITASLKPNKSYKLKAISNSKSIIFSIVDLESGEKIMTSNEIPIVHKSSDLPLDSLIKK
jgi:hypothetical protein